MIDQKVFNQTLTSTVDGLFITDPRLIISYNLLIIATIFIIFYITLQGE